MDCAPASSDILAPTLRHHAGRFWMVCALLAGAPRTILVNAVDPAGPWSDPVWIPDVRGRRLTAPRGPVFVGRRQQHRYETA